MYLIPARVLLDLPIRVPLAGGATAPTAPAAASPIFVRRVAVAAADGAAAILVRRLCVASS